MSPRATWCRLIVAPFLALVALCTGAGAQSRSTVTQPAGTVTFNRDVAPIVFERCATCHQPHGSAPFSLLTYEDARPRARQIAAVTKSRNMPPWKPEPGYGEFAGDRRLTESQIDSIQRWVQDGALRGSPADLPAPPVATVGWQTGQPDLVLTLPEYLLPPGAGADAFRNFVVAVPATIGSRYVSRWEFRPGACCVHHANVLIDPTPASRRLDEEDPLPGYEGLIPHAAAFPDGHFLGWTPGQTSTAESSDLSWRLQGGSDLLVQLHMMPTDKPERIQPAIGLFFTDTPPTRTPGLLRLGSQNIDIPADEKAYLVADTYVVPVDIEVHAVWPHAHHRAKEVTAWATLPDGSRRSLLYIREWDFNWQDHYRYVAPFWLPAGTTLTSQYVYDNSAGNRKNPDRPPKRVLWGNKTSDEMGDLWIQFLTRSERDFEHVSADVERKMVADDILGYETRIRVTPNYVALRNDLALLYLQSGRPDRAMVHFDWVVTLQPESPAAHVNLAAALEEVGRTAEAIAQYREAVRLDPRHVKAHERLAVGLLLLGKTEEAISHLREVVQAEPDRAEALNNLGYALTRAGRLDDAIASLQRALAVRPALVDAHYNLARALSAVGRHLEAVRSFREALARRPEWLPAMKDLAWLEATSPDPTVRAAEDALRLALRAAELSDRRDPSILDTLGAAYAAGGRFDQARQTAESAEALAAVSAPDLVSGIRDRLNLYRARKPFLASPQSNLRR